MTANSVTFLSFYIATDLNSKPRLKLIPIIILGLTVSCAACGYGVMQRLAALKFSTPTEYLHNPHFTRFDSTCQVSACNVQQVVPCTLTSLATTAGRPRTHQHLQMRIEWCQYGTQGSIKARHQQLNCDAYVQPRGNTLQLQKGARARNIAHPYRVPKCLVQYEEQYTGCIKWYEVHAQQK